MLVSQPAQAFSHAQPASRRVPVALWFALVLGSWTLLHAVSHTVLGIDAASPGVRFAWWTLGKVITWLGPTFMFLRRAGVASASWLGLSTARGLRAALLWSAAWLAFQNGCEMLQISVVTRDAPPDNYYALAGPLLVAPCFEEILFRGAMLRLMRAWGYRRDLVVWTSALAFTVLHLPGWIFRLGFSTMLANLFAGIMFFGLAAGYLAWRVPTLWGPIALHFLNNLWTTRALDVVMKELGA